MKYKFRPEKITTVRQRMGLTVSVFAGILGTTRQRVASWESGISKPNQDALAKLCNICGVEPNYFFVFKNVKKQGEAK